MVKVSAVIGLIVAVILGIATHPATAQETPTPAYLAVIDAGSSGTRLTLFGDDPSSLVPVEIMQARQRTAGISSFAPDPDQAGPLAITPLIDQLQTYLAQSGIAPANVPIALLATAGMRNVRRDNPTTAQAILTSTAAAIERAGHPIAANMILPGVQEATLAWLDANAIAGTLQNARRTFGIIEIGGASAQVAFRSNQTEGRGIYQVRVEGASIPVVAASYLGLGGNDARTLMQGQNDAGSFCFPNNAPGADPALYVANAVRPVAAVTAKYAWDRCANAYRRVITTIGGQRTTEARIAPWQLRDQPTFEGTSFIGLGSIPPTLTDLGISSAGNLKPTLKRSVTRTCSGGDAWVRVQSLFVGRSNAFADTLCSTGTYQYEFVFGSRGIGVDGRNFLVGDGRFTRSPAWTSGYAITVLDR